MSRLSKSAVRPVSSAARSTKRRRSLSRHKSTWSRWKRSPARKRKVIFKASVPMVFSRPRHPVFPAFQVEVPGVVARLQAVRSYA